MSPGQSATSQWGWVFHTVQGGIFPGGLRFRPRVVGVVEIWKDLLSRDGNLSSPGAAGSRPWPEGQLSPRVGFMCPNQISNQPVGLGFPHRAEQYRPRGSPFSSPGCRSCAGIEGFIIRGWELILLRVPWLYVRSSANQRSESGAGASTPCGAVST